MRVIASFATATLAVAGCTRDQPRAPAPSTAPAAAPAATPAATVEPGPPPVASDDGQISGTVIETMDSGGYTYAKIDRGGSAVWIAGPATKLAVGAKVNAMTGTLMTGFRSETLQRTFEQIYFVSAFPGAAPAAEPAAGSGATALLEKVEPAAGGQTIAAVYASTNTLAGKPVVVRGKIVKVNSGIMGRNWVHLRDGTGAAGTDDLLVTTADTAALGDVVVARGTLVTNKDFGGGYKYDVLVEDATLAVK